jgi:hypothetical protein
MPLPFRRRQPAAIPPPPPETTWQRAQRNVARYDLLCQLVFERGEHFRRDFGDWVRLRLEPVGGLYLELDSYGRNLGLKRGSGEYKQGSEGYYGGFQGAKVERIGGHFGAPSIHANPDRIEELISLISPLPILNVVR